MSDKLCEYCSTWPRIDHDEFEMIATHHKNCPHIVIKEYISISFLETESGCLFETDKIEYINTLVTFLEKNQIPYQSQVIQMREDIYNVLFQESKKYFEEIYKNKSNEEIEKEFTEDFFRKKINNFDKEFFLEENSEEENPEEENPEEENPEEETKLKKGKE
jgi:hypothetical protein